MLFEITRICNGVVPKYFSWPFNTHVHVRCLSQVLYSCYLHTVLSLKFPTMLLCSWLYIVICLQVVDIPHDSSKPMRLQLDAEWLAVLKSTNHMQVFTRVHNYLGTLPGER